MDGSLCKILGPGLASPRIDVGYIRHRMSQRSTDTSDRIHYSLLQCYLPVNVRCRRDSLSVTDSGSHSGNPFEVPFVDICVTKFLQNFLRRYLKNDMLKILAACHSGAPFQPGAICTCIPCLMVNPALTARTHRHTEYRQQYRAIGQ